MGKVLFSDDASEVLAKNEPGKERYQLLAHLSPFQIYMVGEIVFGCGPGSDLLRAMDQGQGVAARFGSPGDGTFYRRAIETALVDGKMRFQAMEGSPAKGFRLGSFQNAGSDSTEKLARFSYDNNLEAGKDLYFLVMGKQAPPMENMPLLLRAAQEDLLAYLGYLSYNPKQIPKLANPNVVGEELIALTGNRVTRPGSRGVLIANLDQTLVVDTLKVPQVRPTADGRFQPQSSVGLGSRGPDVAYIQGRLGMENPSGEFLDSTVALVRKFQADHGQLPQTGVVDPDTWDALGVNQTVTNAPPPPGSDHREGSQHVGRLDRTIQQLGRLLTARDGERVGGRTHIADAWSRPRKRQVQPSPELSAGGGAGGGRSV